MRGKERERERETQEEKRKEEGEKGMDGLGSGYSLVRLMAVVDTLTTFFSPRGITSQVGGWGGEEKAVRR